MTGAELVRDIKRRLRRLVWVTGVIGTIVVFQAIGFLIPVFIDPDERWELGLFNAPFIASYLVVAALLFVRRTNARVDETMQWVVEDRPPNDREHRETLGGAIEGSKRTAYAWAVAAAVFGVFNALVHSVDFGILAAAAIWLGGESSAALVYLASERILRPVTAKALAARPPDRAVAPGIRLRLMMAWALGTGVPLIAVLVVGATGILADVDSKYVGGAVLFLGLVATGVGVLATMIAAKAIADPVTSVRTALERIERGELDVNLPVDDGSEVGQLQAGFNRMAAGLRERERIRELFGKQVGEDVARRALREGTRLGGEEREIGALFVDLVGSTSMALAMPPTEVVRVLNRFFRVVVEVVEAEGGLVNKFEGDAALCVFGAPVPCDDPAGNALRCARNLAAQLTKDVAEVDFGIGISAGVAVAGNVGAESRFEYTVIGDPVNEAARLAELAKERPERVLASEASVDRASDDEAEIWRLTDRATLRGRDAPTGIAHPSS